MISGISIVAIISFLSIKEISNIVPLEVKEGKVIATQVNTEVQDLYYEEIVQVEIDGAIKELKFPKYSEIKATVGNCVGVVMNKKDGQQMIINESYPC